MATTTRKSSTSGSTKKAAPRKSGTKKAAADAPAKKTAAKKATASKSRGSSPEEPEEKKTAAKRAPRKRASASSDEGSGQSSPKPKRTPAMKVARAAARQLAELTGRQPESVIGIQRTDDGWQVDLEVVESRRIPDSTDILATYRVEADEDGDLTGYQRLRRYVRGKGGDDR
ncbi:MAG TPA: gas vesicle protein [Gaiellaceae bacterium]|nr:gas vesicle protein [Gaiellaceae bacterium]